MLFYLDAGTGSMITQAVAGGVAGIAVAAKLGWRRLTHPFHRGDEAEFAATHEDNVSAQNKTS